MDIAREPGADQTQTKCCKVSDTSKNLLLNFDIEVKTRRKKWALLCSLINVRPFTWSKIWEYTLVYLLKVLDYIRHISCNQLREYATVQSLTIVEDQIILGLHWRSWALGIISLHMMPDLFPSSSSQSSVAEDLAIAIKSKLYNQRQRATSSLSASLLPSTAGRFSRCNLLPLIWCSSHFLTAQIASSFIPTLRNVQL